MSVKAMLASVDAVYDGLLAQLGCSHDGNDARLVSHWQEGDRPGFRIQVTRKADGKSLTRFVDRTGTICV